MLRAAVLLAVTMMGTAAFASRAKTEFKQYVQPDGTVLTLTLWGDERFHCYRDLSLNTFIRDSLGVFHPLLLDVADETPEFFPTRGSTTADIGYADQNWDASHTYRQLVILVAFADTDFSIAAPRDTYHRIFNEPGYNQRSGAGCVADYFRDQSAGKLNLQFDVYGPYKVSSKARSGGSKNFGRSAFREATQMMLAENPDADFSVYDWSDDGYKNVTQVIFVYAGYAGNQAGIEEDGYVWPNTSSFGSVTTPDGYTISDYTASGELWVNDTSCGIGTICHEFSHSLGLPDIYPTSTSSSLPFSLVDEWDLMDGGPITNRGWCPPNYSPLEKMIMGWLESEELTQDTVISDLKPIADGGKAFMVKHTDSEFLLLENRQWTGWDAGLPGRGLVVYHVKFDQNRWLSSGGGSVNNVAGKPYYSIVAADNLDCTAWYDLFLERYGLRSPYQNAGMMNSLLMSSAAYPWQTDSTTFVNRELSATSVPAAKMYDQDAEGSTMLSKAISNITQNADGSVSFAFHASPVSAIVARRSDAPSGAVYTLTGSRVGQPLELLPKGVYIVDGKKIVKR